MLLYDEKACYQNLETLTLLPGSERFYHNKNQIFFNKSCCYGPLLDPDKVSQLPEATPPGKVSSVIRTGLEMVAKAAFDPEKVIDLMQEGCGVRVVVKHKGKILKKVREPTAFVVVVGWGRGQTENRVRENTKGFITGKLEKFAKVMHSLDYEQSLFLVRRAKRPRHANDHART